MWGGERGSLTSTHGGAPGFRGPETSATSWGVGEGLWGDVVGEGAGRSCLATRGVSDAERGGAGAAVIRWRLLAMADGFVGVQGGALAPCMRHREAPGRTGGHRAR